MKTLYIFSIKELVYLVICLSYFFAWENLEWREFIL